MTIVLDFGTWHVEYHLITVVLSDAASSYISAGFPPDRVGAFIGCACCIQASSNNDNVQAAAVPQIRDSAPSNISIGDRVTSYQVRIAKEAGTSGDTTPAFHVILIIRDS